MSLPDEAYGRLLALRSGLRRFLRWSEQQARAAGLTPAQHQLLLAVRGHPDPRGPTIGEVADYLLLRHHSAIGLVDRAEEAGLVTRTRDEHDQRVVRLGLTTEGAERLEALSALHLEELKRLAPHLPGTWQDLDAHQPPHGLPAGIRSPAPEGAREVARISIARVYDVRRSRPGQSGPRRPFVAPWHRQGRRAVRRMAQRCRPQHRAAQVVLRTIRTDSMSSADATETSSTRIPPRTLSHCSEPKLTRVAPSLSPRPVTSTTRRPKSFTRS